MPSTPRPTQITLALVAALAFTAVGVRSSEGSTITWLYEGSVVSSFDHSLVPVGSPATIQLAVDPSNNFIHGVPGYSPDAGDYLFTATIDFAARQYVLSGAFEINEDLEFAVPQPGAILLRYLNLTGPSLDPTALSPRYAPYPLVCYFGFAYPCSLQYSTGANPASSALPSPLPVADFSLYFWDQNAAPAAITVAGTDPSVVPEPSSIVLLTMGLIGLARRRQLR